MSLEQICPKCDKECEWIEEGDYGGYWFCYTCNSVVFDGEEKEQ